MTNRTVGRRSTPNVNALPTLLSATVVKYLRAPVLKPILRFLLTASRHTFTPGDNVTWIFGRCDDKGCFEKCSVSIGKCAREKPPFGLLTSIVFTVETML